MAKKQSTSRRVGIENGVKAVSPKVEKPKPKPGRPRFGSQL